MCDDKLLYSTKAILKYLVNMGRGYYQTVHSLDFGFYNFSGHNIPFYALGYSCLVTFLQNIPDTLKVNPLTFEIQPLIESHPTIHTSSFSYNQIEKPLRCGQFTNAPMSFRYQPRALSWTRSAHNSSESTKRSFRPIHIKKSDSICGTDKPLGPRSYGDGKCSSPESIKTVNALELEPQDRRSIEESTLLNCSNDTVVNHLVLPVPTYLNQKISEVDKNNDAKFDQKIKFDEVSEKENQLARSISSNSKKSAAVSATPERNVGECFNGLKFDDSSSASNALKFDESSSASNGLKFDESSSTYDGSDDSAPPPYVEKDDTPFEPFSNRNDAYDYDQHYYLSSPEEKEVCESLDISAIPFLFMEDDDPIFMLNSGFFDENYGSEYATTNIGNVMKVEEFYELYISEVNNPYKFWFQLDEEHPNPIEELQEHLNMYYGMHSSHESSDCIKKEHMKKGYACAALYDNVWHRGQIQANPEDGYVKIFFVDYGTVDRVRISDVRYILKSFCHIPKLCYRGTLDFVKPISCRWYVDTASFFIRLVENKRLTAGVSEIDIKTNSVRLFLMDRESNININYQLVCEGFAFPEDPRDRYQRHIADVLPSFDSLEQGEYPSLTEVIALLQQECDYERKMQSSIIDEYDCYIPQQASDKEVIQYVEDFQKKKEEGKRLAKQRDVKYFLKFFGNILNNPFLNGTTTETMAEEKTTNPFEMRNPFLDEIHS